MPCFARLTAPDTLMASVAANGGCRPFAAHFFAGHGVTLRSTLRAWLRMRIRVAVLRLLPLLRASHMHEWLNRRVSRSKGARSYG